MRFSFHHRQLSSQNTNTTKMRLSFFQVLLLSVAVNAFTPAESTKRPQNFAVQASAEDDLEKTRRVIAQFHDKGPSKKRTSLVSSPHISSQPPTTTDTTTQTSKLRKLTMWRPLGRSLQLRTKLSNLNQKVSRSLQKAPFIRQGSSSTLSDDQAFLFQSLIKDRRTGTSLVYTLNDREKEQELIKAAIHRAVECAHFAPNHKRTEPTSFVQIMSDSSAARELGEIVYQVSARTKSVPVGEKKKEKWSQIPAYLVAIVHENQSALKIDETAKFDALPYAPPETERQLEDVSITRLGFLETSISVSDSKLF